MMISSIYLIYLGLFLFSLVLKKHYKELLKRDSNIFIKFILGILGTILLTIALVLLIKLLGVSLGLTYWTGFLGLIIIFIALIYTYAPRIIIYMTLILFLIMSILTFI